MIKSELDYNISRIVFRITDLLEERPKLFNFSPFGESGAILLANPGIHEGNEIFDIRANRQTLCNLLTVICVNKINSSRKWDRSDIFDILKIGDKNFCKISNDREDDNLICSWNHLENKLKIGIYNFSFEYEVEIGIFYKKIESNPGSLTQQSKIGLNSTQKSMSLTKQVPMSKSIESSKSVKDLREILEEWDLSESTDAVLESHIVRLAIWKCNDLFFIFDPKSCKDNGTISDDRKQISQLIEIGKFCIFYSSSNFFFLNLTFRLV